MSHRSVFAPLAALVTPGLVQWVKEILLGAPKLAPVPVPVRATRPHGRRRSRR